MAGLTPSSWLMSSVFSEPLEPQAQRVLSDLRPQLIKARSVLFHPGVRPEGFLIVIDGRVGVYLVGKGGRELLLYSVSRGETCIQTTLGLLGQEPYSAEAVAETDLVAVMVPQATFETLVATSGAFRGFVFRAFAARVADVMFVLEQVAFVKVESRLAHVLRERADPSGTVSATHQELAVAIGSAREVVTRQLRALASRGLVALERGAIEIVDPAELARLAEEIA